MTWEWSHAPEAYEDAFRNLERLPAEMLAEIWAEWNQWDQDSAVPGLYDQHPETGDTYEETLKQCRHDTATDPRGIAAMIWEKAATLRNCTNGGHRAHMCPFGCEPHMVAFDDEEETTP